MTNGQTVRLKKRFLESFAVTGNVTESCQAVGLKRRATVYEWQEHDDDFAFAYQEAEITATEVLESEARRRAVDGTEKPVYQQGAMVGTITERSDTLLIFLLKARAPEKYRENVALHHSGRVSHEDRPDLSHLTIDELEAYERLLAKATGNHA